MLFHGKYVLDLLAGIEQIMHAHTYSTHIAMWNRQMLKTRMQI